MSEEVAPLDQPCACDVYEGSKLYPSAERYLKKERKKGGKLKEFHTMSDVFFTRLNRYLCTLLIMSIERFEGWLT